MRSAHDPGPRRSWVVRTTAIGALVTLLATACAATDEPPDEQVAAPAVPELTPRADDTAPDGIAFSHPTGFYDEPFDLEVTAADPDDTVFYTLDGTVPDPDRNPDSTHEYRGPIRVADRTGEPLELALIDTTVSGDRLGYFRTRPGPPDLDHRFVEQATVVRARTASGHVAAATFFVGQVGVRDELAVASLKLDPAHLFDHDSGIYVAGRVFDEWRDGDEWDPTRRWDIPTNYNERGREWERPHPDDLDNSVVFAFCGPGGDCGYQRDVGVRAHGGFSRSYPQKSLRLYARDVYGDRVFGHRFFGADGPTDHRRLLLRNSGNDNRRLMFLDAYLQSLMGELAADTQAYMPTVLFINGEYWGIHNLRERYDRHYLEVVHGADPDAVEILDNTSGPLEGTTAEVVDEWWALLDELGGMDPASDAFAVRVEEEIDVDSLFDHYIAHLFAANSDWGPNNIRWWREPDGPHEPGEGTRDGRWRWLISDFDHMGGGGGNYDAAFDVLAEQMAPTDDARLNDGYPFLLHRLLEADTLRTRFLSRFEHRLNTTFDPERTLAALEQFRDRLADEYVRHTARWQTLTIDEWHDHVDRLAEFMRERPRIQREQLAEAFGDR